MTTTKRPTLSEIAERIGKHTGLQTGVWLDGAIVVPHDPDPPVTRFYVLPRPEAERYLAWLDAGGVGKHWAALDGAGRQSAS